MDLELYEQIKKEYDEFYRNLLKQGRLPLGDTGTGFWGSAITHEVFEAFKKIKVHRFKNFLDLGSGDGKIVFLASLFGLNAYGIEINKELHEKALELKNKLNLNATFINDDFYNFDISNFDIVFVNPDTPMHRGMEEKLLNELNGKLIFYGHHFHPIQLKKEQDFIINGTLITVYRK